MSLENKDLYIFGYSGHALVALDIAFENDLLPVGYFDVEKATYNNHNLNYCGSEHKIDIAEIVKENFVFPSIGDNKIRKKIVTLIEKKNLNQVNLISSKASISSFVQFEKYIMVAANAVINSQAKIGKGVIINTSAVVEHECQIGAYSHIAPGAVLTGNVSIGENCLVGANSVINPGISVADNCIIGAGAVVVKNITKPGTWIGNPAKKIK